MSNSSHCLVIPGLYHLPAEELQVLNSLHLPKLEQFFAHAKKINSEQKDFDSVLHKQLSSESNQQSKSLSYVQCFNPDKKANSLIASPILLKADINSTWIQPPNESDNIKQIINDMICFFADDIELLDECDGHYILHFKHCEVVTDLPFYLSVLGKKIDSYQQSIRDNLEWFKLLNEMQMYLHGHALNKTDSGQQILNSLWFWGGDSQQPLQIDKRVVCDDILLHTVLNKNQQNESIVLIKTDLLKYLKLNASVSLTEFFTQLEKDLEAIEITSLCIDACDGQQLVYDSFAVLKFWQSKATLVAAISMNDFHDSFA